MRLLENGHFPSAREVTGEGLRKWYGAIMEQPMVAAMQAELFDERSHHLGLLLYLQLFRHSTEEGAIR